MSFGADHVHAVVNATPGAVTSVHVYSPPLRSMSFSRAANGELVVDRVDDVAGALAVP